MTLPIALILLRYLYEYNSFIWFITLLLYYDIILRAVLRESATYDRVSGRITEKPNGKIQSFCNKRAHYNG